MVMAVRPLTRIWQT